MFDQNSISRTNPSKLVSRWSSQGLVGFLGLHCKQCKNAKKKTAERKLKNKTSLEELPIISFLGTNPPAHLYFNINIATIFDPDNQKNFMASMDWPVRINVCGVVYTLISRGFWGEDHIWGKVVRHVNGFMGVWMHDNNANGGYAFLVNTDVEGIGGTHNNTTALL